MNGLRPNCQDHLPIYFTIAFFSKIKAISTDQCTLIQINSAPTPSPKPKMTCVSVTPTQQLSVSAHTGTSFGGGPFFGGHPMTLNTSLLRGLLPSSITSNPRPLGSVPC